MSDTHIPEGFTVYVKGRQGRLVYDSKWSPSLPWKSYWKGTAGACYPSLGAAAQAGYRPQETDQDREENAKRLRALGLSIPEQLPKLDN